ncbi:MAG TPA: hypothetical protein VEI97_20315 [bacterium]|nr:hypothetical protein [bacterium]
MHTLMRFLAGATLALPLALAPLWIAPAAADDTVTVIRPTNDVQNFEKPANQFLRGDYKLEVETEPPVPDVGEPFNVVFRIDGLGDNPTPALAGLPDGPVHFVLVNRTFDYFTHLHPTEVSPGVYKATATVPYSGGHILYVTAAPIGYNVERLRVPFWVEGVAVNGKTVTAPPGTGEMRELPGSDEPADVVIAGTQPAAARIGSSVVDVNGYRISLEPSTLTRTPTGATKLTLNIEKDGQPATDLTPIAGAPSYLVVVAEEGDYWVQTTPVMVEKNVSATTQITTDPMTGNLVIGPKVEYEVTFPAAGRYWLWAEFNTSSGPITVPFVVDVK